MSIGRSLSSSLKSLCRDLFVEIVRACSIPAPDGTAEDGPDASPGALASAAGTPVPPPSGPSLGSVLVICDQASLRAVNSFCRLSDLYEAGVSSVEALERERSPLPDVDALYFLDPEDPDSVDRLKADFANPKQPQHNFLHLLFSRRCPLDVLQQLALNELLAPRVRSCREAPLGRFAVFHQHAFHLDLSGGLRNPQLLGLLEDYGNPTSLGELFGPDKFSIYLFGNAELVREDVTSYAGRAATSYVAGVERGGGMHGGGEGAVGRGSGNAFRSCSLGSHVCPYHIRAATQVGRGNTKTAASTTTAKGEGSWGREEGGRCWGRGWRGGGGGAGRGHGGRGSGGGGDRAGSGRDNGIGRRGRGGAPGDEGGFAGVEGTQRSVFGEVGEAGSCLMGH